MNRFQLLGRDGAARAGTLRTSRGGVATPAFMPVGTQGTVKAMTLEELRAAGAEIILAKVVLPLCLGPSRAVTGDLSMAVISRCRYPGRGIMMPV